MAPTAPAAIACYRLAPGVAIRPERFGGLVYRYDNRRLYFLYSHRVVEFVNGLDGGWSLQENLDDFLTVHGITATDDAALVKAVGQLEQLEILKIG